MRLTQVKFLSKYIKIRLNLTEAHFIKLLVEAILDAENEREQDKLIAQDILNKLNK